MIVSKSISKYFESIEAGRGPPKQKKKTFFIIPPLFFSERNQNEPANENNQAELQSPTTVLRVHTRPTEDKKDTFSLRIPSRKSSAFPAICYTAASKLNRSRSTALRICRASSIPVGTLWALTTTNCSAPVSSSRRIAFFSEAVSLTTSVPGTRMS